MNNLIICKYDPNKHKECLQNILCAIEKKSWIKLSSNQNKIKIISTDLLPEKAGIIINSSGSSGRSYECLHTYENLDISASSSGNWLINQGIEIKNSLLLNSLPLNHVSGLMPWWRSRCWNATYKWIHPELMKHPIELEENYKQLFRKHDNPILTSLVPTQLHRLIYHPAGIRWLQSFSLIWIGGSSLPNELETIARRQKINLSPCYGATETAAMVSALPPKDFLLGRNDCGYPLKDVKLEINQEGLLQVKTKRLAIGRLNNGKIEQISNTSGWWKSGDIAYLHQTNNRQKLEIVGRVDNAIQSGSETIFPEILEQRLLQEAQSKNMPLRAVLFLPVPNKEWGQRIVALVRFHKKNKASEDHLKNYNLKSLVKDWLAAERPIEWHECNELRTNQSGKWNRNFWKEWLDKERKKIKDLA